MTQDTRQFYKKLEWNIFSTLLGTAYNFQKETTIQNYILNVLVKDTTVPHTKKICSIVWFMPSFACQEPHLD